MILARLHVKMLLLHESYINHALRRVSIGQKLMRYQAGMSVAM